MHLHEGPDKIEKRKSPVRGWIQTHDLSVTRPVLYCCATTTAQALKIVEIVHSDIVLSQAKRLKYFILHSSIISLFKLL